MKKSHLLAIELRRLFPWSMNQHLNIDKEKKNFARCDIDFPFVCVCVSFSCKQKNVSDTGRNRHNVNIYQFHRNISPYQGDTYVDWNLRLLMDDKG